jgi:hypothetical protein
MKNNNDLVLSNMSVVDDCSSIYANVEQSTNMCEVPDDEVNTETEMIVNNTVVTINKCNKNLSTIIPINVREKP